MQKQKAKSILTVRCVPIAHKVSIVKLTPIRTPPSLIRFTSSCIIITLSLTTQSKMTIPPTFCTFLSFCWTAPINGQISFSYTIVALSGLIISFSLSRLDCIDTSLLPLSLDSQLCLLPVSQPLPKHELYPRLLPV